MRTVGRATALAVILVILAALAPRGLQRPAAGASRYTRSVKNIAPSLDLISIIDRRGPNRISVLRLDPSAALAIDLGLAQDRLPGRETTSDMARRHGALAAINGTYGLPWGRPIGLFVQDSYLKTSPLVWGNAFSLSRDKQLSYVGHPDLHVRLRGLLSQTELVIGKWNEPGPGKGEVVEAFTPEGGRYVSPPKDACSARLMETNHARWDHGGDGVVRWYTVEEVRCAQRPLSRRGGVVVAASRTSMAAKQISSLMVGEVAELRWSVGWAGVTDAIAGNPVLVADGRNVAYDCASYFCDRHPRTGVGVTTNGHVLLVTVDGRQPGYSVGMTLLQFAQLFRDLDATAALNVDGGGSTTMVVNDSLVNSPSDAAGERAVSSSILVLPAEDPGEPYLYPSLPGDQLFASSPQGPADLGSFAPASDPSILDPASTGGLLDAQRRGDLSLPTGELSHSLLRIAKRFARSHAGRVLPSPADR
jgi:Phosphodiester glycosidase